MSDGNVWIQRIKATASETMVIGAAAAVIILCLQGIDYLRASRAAASNSNVPLLSIGSKLQMGMVDFQQNPLSIVLVSSPTCSYCLASKEFHAKLIAESQRYSVPLYVAVPSRRQADQYLRDVGFAQSSVKEWKDLNLRAEGTPTIVAIDQQGIIKGIWVGVLAPFDEAQLLKAIKRLKPMWSQSHFPVTFKTFPITHRKNWRG